MTFNEMLSFTKVYNVAFRLAHPSTVTSRDKEITMELLKKMVDNRNDWSKEQKEQYKLLVDFVKEKIK